MQLVSFRRAFAVLSLFALVGACENAPTPPQQPQPPSKLSLAGRTQLLNALGDTVRVSVTATDASGAAVSVAGVVWSSSNPQAATVVNGFVVAQAVGATTITATLQGLQAHWPLEVRQVPASVRLTAPKALIAIGESSQLTAVLLDSLGKVVPGGTFEWSSSLPMIASVTPDGGLAAGVGSGRTRIRAASGGLMAETNLDVRFTGNDGLGPDFMKISYSFVPASISLSGADSVAVLTVRGEDEGMGLATIVVAIGKDTELVRCTMDNPTAGNAQNGTWTCPVRRSQLAGAGTYRILELIVRDYKGNGFDSYAANLEAFNKQAYLAVTP